MNYLAALKRFPYQLIGQLNLLLVFLTQPRKTVRKIVVPQGSWSTMLPVLAPGSAMCVARRCHQKQVNYSRLELL
jgi:hypothetical protein